MVKQSLTARIAARLFPRPQFLAASIVLGTAATAIPAAPSDADTSIHQTDRWAGDRTKRRAGPQSANRPGLACRDLTVRHLLDRQVRADREGFGNPRGFRTHRFPSRGPGSSQRQLVQEVLGTRCESTSNRRTPSAAFSSSKLPRWMRRRRWRGPARTSLCRTGSGTWMITTDMACLRRPRLAALARTSRARAVEWSGRRRGSRPTGRAGPPSCAR